MIKCDVFELELDLDTSGPSPMLEYRYWTDLPCGTKVILELTRSYRDSDNDLCLWTLFEEDFSLSRGDLVDFNGGSGVLDVFAGDRNGLKEFEEFERDDPSSVIVTPVSDEISTSVVVGIRQRLRAYGKNNKNLTGAKVDKSGGLKTVSVERRVRCPMLPELQPPVKVKSPVRRLLGRISRIRQGT